MDSLVITGIGVVSCAGDSKDSFYKKIIINKEPSFKLNYKNYDDRTVKGFIIGDLQLEKYLKIKGSRYLDRMTHFALIASISALRDSGFEITKKNKSNCGIALGNTFGSLDSAREFSNISFTKGLIGLNPAYFANTIISSTASQIAISLNLMGPNVSISSGSTATLDAFGYCINSFSTHDFDFMLIGGVEELSLMYYDYFKSIFPLEINQPVLGEGSVMFCVEPIEKAKQRNSFIYAKIAGYYQIYGRDIPIADISKTLLNMLFNIDISISEINYIITNKNGTNQDVLINKIINSLFGSENKRPNQYSCANFIGETFSASGAFQILLAICLIINKNSSKASKYSSNALIINCSNDGSKSFILIKG